MMRTADLLKGLTSPGGADLVPLRRFDIVYVPRSGAAETGLFMQQYFRDLSAGQFGFSYAINGNIQIGRRGKRGDVSLATQAQPWASHSRA